MPVFLERFVLPVLAAVVVALALTNPMNFDPAPRIAGTVAVLALAGGAAFFIHRRSGASKPRPLSSELRHREQQPQIPGRQYVDVDPNHLVRVYEQHMAIQADRMVAPYLNKWLRVSGPLKNVSTTGTDLLMVTFQRKSSPSPVVMFFDKAWGDRLATKLRDSILVIDGRIEKIDNWSVRLVDCELVS